MKVFHGLAIGFALLMLARHLPEARAGRPVAIFTCLLSLAVLAIAVKGLAGR
jgi:hypothetical protein